MAVFMLETDSATGTSTQVTSLSSQLESVASNVEGYDTSAEEFDFAGPKGVLAASIKACATKMKNTSNFIESVVSSHTSFQNAVKFETAEEKAAREAAEKKAKSGNSNTSSSGNYSNSGSYNSSNGGHSSSSSSGPGSSSSSSSSSTPEAKTEPKTTPETEPKTTPETEPKTTPETTPESAIIKEKEITEKVEKLSEKDFKDTELSGASKKIFDNAEYNEEGYATFNGMLIISCASTFGAIGDIIEFTLKDGSKVKCIIGTIDDNLKGEVVFAVNDKFNKDNEKNITNNLVDNIDKIVNKAPGQPALGVYTKDYESGENKLTIADTKGDLDKYLEGIKDKLVQNIDKEKYKDKDLSFAETHAYGLFSGKTDDTIETASSYKKSGFFTSFKSDSLDETLNKIYTEISNGRPVVAQISENAAGTVGHYVTIVGFNKEVTNPSKLTEKDLIILDSADGTIKPMDGETNKLVTAKQTHNGKDGYTLRVLKDDDPNKIITNIPEDKRSSSPTESSNTTQEQTQNREDNTTQTDNTQTETQTDTDKQKQQITESEEPVQV